MTFEIDGRTFRTQIASDIDRDGMGLEVFECFDSNEEFLIEVWRDDAAGSFFVHVETSPLPLELFEVAANQARIRLVPNPSAMNQKEAAE